jgi:hypothetical protein
LDASALILEADASGAKPDAINSEEAQLMLDLASAIGMSSSGIGFTLLTSAASLGRLAAATGAAAAASLGPVDNMPTTEGWI